MKIIENKLIPFKGFCAINLFGYLFCRDKREINDVVVNHEEIHTSQMKELGYIPFYVLYFIEWLIRLLFKGNAYRNISFEREAYTNQSDESYIARRKKYSYIKYIKWRKSS